MDVKDQEKAIELLEAVSNLLLGMSLDPRIPSDTREVMRNRGTEIDRFTKRVIEYAGFE